MASSGFASRWVSCTWAPAMAIPRGPPLDSDRGLSGEQAEEIAILLGEVPSRVPIVEGDDDEKTAMIQQR